MHTILIATQLPTDSVLVRGCEHIVAQNKNNTEIKYSNVIVKTLQILLKLKLTILSGRLWGYT